MSNSLSEKSPRPVGIILVLLAIAALIVLIVLIGGNPLGGEETPEPAPTAETTDTPTVQPSPSPEPMCAGTEVMTGMSAILQALEAADYALAEQELERVYSLYAELADDPACGQLAQDLLGIQALVRASVAWQTALDTGSARQVEEAAQLASLAAALNPAGLAKDLAEGLAAIVEGRRESISQFTSPNREVTDPETLVTEQAGGLHPLCDVNTLIKPLLLERSGTPVVRVSRIEIISDTLFVLADGHLLTAELERVLGPSPAVFLQTADEDEIVVAGALVKDLVDLTASIEGDLLLLEKSGRLLRRTSGGEWSLERPTGLDELPIAVAPYNTRAYLLDPSVNQIWRFQSGAGDYSPEFFAEGASRDLQPAVDLAIDGAIYVARHDSWVQRYYVGVQDANFWPDTDLGTPTAIFLPDEPDSVLVYVVDGAGRRVLGLNRETGAYRLGFNLNVKEASPLSSGTIYQGRLFLTDEQNLYMSILTPSPTPLVDCPGFPFSPAIPFDQPELVEMDLRLPVSVTLPSDVSLYPGGRWPSLGYGVLDGLALVGAPVSDTVRAIAPGVISQIVRDPTPLLDTDLGVISTTRQVPAENLDALWGKQIWIDHGNGVQTRYGGLAAILPSLSEGQDVLRLTILGFVGEDPILLGLWVDGEYVGSNYSVQETALGYSALLTRD